MARCLIGIGSNKTFFGRSPAQLVESAVEVLGSILERVTCSPLYRSDAWPDPTAPAYVNAVVIGFTSTPPEGLLDHLQTIEASFGRVRFDDPDRRYAPRTLDLDLLAHGETICQSARLTLPHPGLAERDFVLRPLSDLLPDWAEPLDDASAGEKRAQRLPFVGVR